MQTNNKRKPTLKELMVMQGKIKSDGQAAEKKPAQKKQPSLKEQMAKAAKPPPAPPKSKWQETRDSRIKTMLEEDPEQAAELLRKLFLKGE